MCEWQNQEMNEIVNEYVKDKCINMNILFIINNGQQK